MLPRWRQIHEVGFGVLAAATHPKRPVAERGRSGRGPRGSGRLNERVDSVSQRIGQAIPKDSADDSHDEQKKVSREEYREANPKGPTSAWLPSFEDAKEKNGESQRVDDPGV
jgi:hypothetical protein